MILESEEFQMMFPGGWLGAVRKEFMGTVTNHEASMNLSHVFGLSY